MGSPIAIIDYVLKSFNNIPIYLDHICSKYIHYNVSNANNIRIIHR